MSHVYVTAGHIPKELQPVACTRLQPAATLAPGSRAWCALSHMTETIEKPAAAAITPQARVDAWLADFEAALAVRDVERVVAKFAVDSFWRDLVSFTWNLKTVEGRDGVADMLQRPARRDRARPVSAPARRPPPTARRRLGVHRVRDRRRSRHRASAPQDRRRRQRRGLDAADRDAGTQGPRGAQGRDPRHGRGARLRRRHPVVGREAARTRNAPSGRSEQPYTLVVGGGQGGIALGARLRQLGVPAIVVDKHDAPGDQWRKRYKSLCLHDPVWYDHLPYMPFPQNWPVFAPKDKIGDWLEFYTRVMEVPYWSKTTLPVGVLRRGREAVDRRDRPRRRAADAAPHAAGAGHRHVRQAEHADAARAGRLPRRAAPLQRPPRPGPLRRQARRGDRVQQLRARHLQGARRERRRHDDGAAVVDPHREVGLADGHRPRRPLLGAGRGVRHDDREGRPDVRLAAVPDHARVPDPDLRRDPRAGQGLLRPAGRGRLRIGLGRRRFRPLHEVPAPRLRLLHRRRRLRSGRRRHHQAGARSGRAASPRTRWC